MSLTNAAEVVLARLAADYPEDVVEVIEHYAAMAGYPEHVDVVWLEAGRPRWQLVHPELLTENQVFGEQADRPMPLS